MPSRNHARHLEDDLVEEGSFQSHSTSSSRLECPSSEDNHEAAPSRGAAVRSDPSSESRPWDGRPELVEDDGAPVPSSQIAAGYDDEDKDASAAKIASQNTKLDLIADDGPPRRDYDEEESAAMKKIAANQNRIGSAADANDNALQQPSINPQISPTEARPRGQSTPVTRPPPPSMMREQSGDIQPALEATLVQSVEGTLIRQDGTVYQATPIHQGYGDGDQLDDEGRSLPTERESSWWKCNQRYLVFGLVLVFCVALAVMATLLATQGNDGENNNAEPPQPPVIRRPTGSPTQSPLGKTTGSPTGGPTIAPSADTEPTNLTPDQVSSWMWIQQGEGFAGEANEGRFGESVAISGDGRTMAAGADYKGQVKVYHNENRDEGSNWKQRGWIITEGYVVDLSHDGNILAIGGPYYDAVGSGVSDDSGKVTVHEWDDTDMIYRQRGQTLHGENSTMFGSAVSLSSDGKTLAVGAPYYFGAGKAGFVKIFRWNDVTLNYDQVGQAINGEDSEDRFGAYISLSGDGTTLAVGAPADRGKVKVYMLDDETLVYNQLRQSFIGEAGYDPNGNSVRDALGSSVSLSFDGKVLAIGLGNRSYSGTGQDKLYEWDAENSKYKQRGQSIFIQEPGSVEGRDLVRWTVSLSRDGTIVAIGQSGADVNGINSGQVTVHRWDEETLSYMQLGQALNGEANGDSFGESVSLSGDGRTISIGAPFSKANGFNSGKAEIYYAETQN